MINVFSQMACICHFVLFFVSCPEPPMVISSVGSFLVQSGGSLIIFQLFRCRNLTLNRFFLLFLEAGMFYTLGGVSMPHMFVHTHTFICHMHLYTP